MPDAGVTLVTTQKRVGDKPLQVESQDLSDAGAKKAAPNESEKAIDQGKGKTPGTLAPHAAFRRLSTPFTRRQSTLGK